MVVSPALQPGDFGGQIESSPAGTTLDGVSERSPWLDFSRSQNQKVREHGAFRIVGDQAGFLWAGFLYLKSEYGERGNVIVIYISLLESVIDSPPLANRARAFSNRSSRISKGQEGLRYLLGGSWSKFAVLHEIWTTCEV